MGGVSIGCNRPPHRGQNIATGRACFPQRTQCCRVSPVDLVSFATNSTIELYLKRLAKNGYWRLPFPGVQGEEVNILRFHTSPRYHAAMPAALRIAMWSGPRNLSTAMMRAFSSRPDTAVLDEPFYAHYLRETGIDHPGREEVIAAYENDWRRVTDFITGPVPGGKSIWYQKHMAHHMLPHIDVQRLVVGGELTHTFLIRDPIEVITSYTKVHQEMTLAETGLPYQVDLLGRVKSATGKTPPVVDAKDVLLDPRRTLGKLCESLRIEFTEKMLTWPRGPHPDDGNWAPHWYESVYESTGFAKYHPKNEPVPQHLKQMCDHAIELYKTLAAHRL